MNPVKQFTFIGIALIAFTACNSKPKPISNNITKTAVTVDGKKDSVINNPEKNYSNATVSEPCVKCLLQIVQATDSYKKLTAGAAPSQIVYDINWITSKTPKAIGNGVQVINGMQIDVNKKTGSQSNKLTTFLYNNENARFYLLNNQNNYDVDSKVDSASLKKIRNSCFLGRSIGKIVFF